MSPEKKTRIINLLNEIQGLIDLDDKKMLPSYINLKTSIMDKVWKIKKEMTNK